MRHRQEKRIIATFLLLIMIMACILPGMKVAAAGSQIAIKADTVSVSPGNVVTISIQVNTAALQAAAFSVKVEAPTDTFTVSKVVSNLEDIYYGDERKNQILFNWYSDKDITFNAGEELVQIRLRVSEYAELGTYEIKLSDMEFYNIKHQKVAVELPVEALTVTVENKKSEAVIAAEALIEAIGKVEATTESLDKITDAQLAFSNLSASEKSQVENYSVLQAAIDTYNRLKEEEAAQAGKDTINSSLEAFRTAHADVLKLTEDTVSIADQTAVLAAIADYMGQDAYIRKLLRDNEYQLLQTLNAKINSLILYESAVNVAQDQVVSFRDTYQTLLTTTVDMLPSSELSAIQLMKEMTEAAIATYQEGYNTIAKEILKEDYEWIVTLYERLVELEIMNAPDEEWVTEAYNAFREKYLTLLLKTPLDVTEADIPEIQDAIAELKEQKTRVKGKLVNEYEHLMKLLNATNSQQITAEGEQEIQKIETIVERVIEKQVPVTVTEAGEKRVQVLGVELTSGGWFGLLVFIINIMTMILFAIPGVVGYRLGRKKEGTTESC